MYRFIFFYPYEKDKWNFYTFDKFCLYFELAIFVLQRKFLFEVKKPAVMEVHTVYDGIDIYLINKNSSTDIVFFHGSIISGVVYKKLLKDMADKTSHNVISINMRGVFNFRGVPSEKGIRNEIDTFSNYVRKRGKNIIVFGQSLGCCLAIQFSRLVGSSKVILENPFIDYKSVIKYKLYSSILAYLVVDTWKNTDIKYLKNVLFLLSDKDNLINNSEGLQLAELAHNSSIQYLKGSTHFDAARNREYYYFINSYIKLILDD